MARFKILQVRDGGKLALTVTLDFEPIEKSLSLFHSVSAAVPTSDSVVRGSNGRHSSSSVSICQFISREVPSKPTINCGGLVVLRMSSTIGRVAEVNSRLSTASTWLSESNVSVTSAEVSACGRSFSVTCEMIANVPRTDQQLAKVIPGDVLDDSATRMNRWPEASIAEMPMT